MQKNEKLHSTYRTRLIRWLCSAFGALVLGVGVIIVAGGAANCGDSDYPVTETGHEGGTCTKIVVGDDPDNWTCGWLYGDDDACEGEYHYEDEDCACLDGEISFDCYGNDGQTYPDAGIDYESENDCFKDKNEQGFYCHCQVTVTKMEAKDLTDCADCPNNS